MCKELFISTKPFSKIVFICLIFFFSSSILFALSAEMTQYRDAIKALIDAKEYTQAHAAIQALYTTHAEHEELPEVLLSSAGYLTKNKRHADARQLYLDIADGFPQERQNAMMRVMLCDFQLALEAKDAANAVSIVEVMKRDYAGSPQLRGCLGYMALRFRETSNFNEASQLYHHVAQQYGDPDGNLTVRSLASDVDYSIAIDDKAAMLPKLERFMSETAGHPHQLGFLEILLNKFNKPNRLKYPVEHNCAYEYIANHYPDKRPYALLRIHICDFEQALLQEDFQEARLIAEQLKPLCAVEPRCVGTLQHMALTFREENQFKDAAELYQYTAEYSGDEDGSLTVRSLASDVEYSLSIDDEENVMPKLNHFLMDTADHPHQFSF